VAVSNRMTRASLISRRSSSLLPGAPLSSVCIEKHEEKNLSTLTIADYIYLASLPDIDIPFLADCNNFLIQFPELGEHYIPIAKIGEGFSLEMLSTSL
jgi:hypothetical protein